MILKRKKLKMGINEEFWNSWLKKNKNIIIYNDDGSIDVDKSVDIRGSNISKIIPKFNKVYGYFDCTYCRLESLENFPKIITYSFYFDIVSLKSLKGLNIDGIQGFIYDNYYNNIDKTIFKAFQNNDVKWLLLNNKNHKLNGYHIISSYLKGELFNK